MSDFPPINDELRPKQRLKRHTETEPASDAEIEASSRRLGERWGATTRIQQEAELPRLPRLSPVVSIRGYIPDYLDTELTMKSAERRVTKTFLIMEALAKAGYRVEEHDMVQDRRKMPRGR
jgi:hypothetical protein